MDISLEIFKFMVYGYCAFVVIYGFFGIKSHLKHEKNSKAFRKTLTPGAKCQVYTVADSIDAEILEINGDYVIVKSKHFSDLVYPIDDKKTISQ